MTKTFSGIFANIMTVEKKIKAGEIKSLAKIMMEETGIQKLSTKKSFFDYCNNLSTEELDSLPISDGLLQQFADLYLSINSSTSSLKKQEDEKKEKSKKPLTGFFNFCVDKREESESKLTAKELGQLWKELSDETKKEYNDTAKKAMELFKQENQLSDTTTSAKTESKKSEKKSQVKFQEKLADSDNEFTETKESDEESDAKAEESDANTEESDANGEESDANGKESDANGEESDANGEESDANGEESDAKAKESDAKVEESVDRDEKTKKPSSEKSKKDKSKKDKSKKKKK